MTKSNLRRTQITHTSHHHSPFFHDGESPNIKLIHRKQSFSFNSLNSHHIVMYKSALLNCYIKGKTDRLDVRGVRKGRYKSDDDYWIRQGALNVRLQNDNYIFVKFQNFN